MLMLLRTLVQAVRVVTSPTEQMMILNSCHTDATCGHVRVTKTWRRVAEQFYWKEMVADTFYFYDTSKVFREENSGTDLTVYNRDPSGGHIVWQGTDFTAIVVPGVQIFRKIWTWGPNFV